MAVLCTENMASHPACQSTHTVQTQRDSTWHLRRRCWKNNCTGSGAGKLAEIDCPHFQLHNCSTRNAACLNTCRCSDRPRIRIDNFHHENHCPVGDAFGIWRSCFGHQSSQFQCRVSCHIYQRKWNRHFHKCFGVNTVQTTCGHVWGCGYSFATQTPNIADIPRDSTRVCTP